MRQSDATASKHATSSRFSWLPRTTSPELIFSGEYARCMPRFAPAGLDVTTLRQMINHLHQMPFRHAVGSGNFPDRGKTLSVDARVHEDPQAIAGESREAHLAGSPGQT